MITLSGADPQLSQREWLWENTCSSDNGLGYACTTARGPLAHQAENSFLLNCSPTSHLADCWPTDHAMSQAHSHHTDKLKPHTLYALSPLIPVVLGHRAKP